MTSSYEEQYEKANVLLLSDGNLEGALIAFKNCLELCTSDADVIFVLPNIVSICTKLRNYSALIDYSRSLLEAEKRIFKEERFTTLLSLGFGLRQTGEFIEAINILQRALTLTPDQVTSLIWVHQNLALALDSVGSYPSAFDYLYQAGRLLCQLPPDPEVISFVSEGLLNAVWEIVQSKFRSDDNPKEMETIVAQIPSAEFFTLLTELQKNGVDHLKVSQLFDVREDVLARLKIC